MDKKAHIPVKWIEGLIKVADSVMIEETLYNAKLFGYINSIKQFLPKKKRQ